MRGSCRAYRVCTSLLVSTMFPASIIFPSLIGLESDFKSMECHALAQAVLHVLQHPLEPDVFDRTSLHYAALYKSEIGIFEMGSISDIDPNHIDCLGNTALHILLQHQTMNSSVRLVLVRALLRGGADPNVGGPGSLTPLMMAVLTTDVPLVKLLCDFGADVNARYLTDAQLHFPNKMTALSLAASMNLPDVIRCLKGPSVEPTTIFHALQKASPSMKAVIMG